MDPRDLLEQAVRTSLKTRGFKKRGSTWRSDMAETVLVLNIQKSQWGPQFYVNLGIFFRALGDAPSPPSDHCHIQVRLARVLDDSLQLEKALDFKSDMAESERAEVLRESVDMAALPWLEARDSDSKARDALLREERPLGLVMVSARQHLGVAAA